MIVVVNQMVLLNQTYFMVAVNETYRITKVVLNVTRHRLFSANRLVELQPGAMGSCNTKRNVVNGSDIIDVDF